MTTQEQIDHFNVYPIGTNVTYWPVFHRQGKRTVTKIKAYLAGNETLVHLAGIHRPVDINHVQFGLFISTDSPCFDKQFDHKWR